MVLTGTNDRVLTTKSIPSPENVIGSPELKISSSILFSLGAIGDFILTLPLARALRNCGPLAFITRACYRSLLPEDLSDAPFIDVERGDMGSLFGEDVELNNDVCSLLEGSMIHAMVRRDEILGRNLTRLGVQGIVWYNPRPVSPPHITRQYLQKIGSDAAEYMAGEPIMPRKNSEGRALWLHAGSGTPAKNIPPEVLVEVGTFWKTTRQAELIVSAGEAEFGILEQIRNVFATAGLFPRYVIAPPLADLRRLLAEEAAVYLGADTGITHLAAALGIPTVAVFRSTDPAIWAPLGSVRIVTEDGGNLAVSCIRAIGHFLSSHTSGGGTEMRR